MCSPACWASLGYIFPSVIFWALDMKVNHVEETRDARALDEFMEDSINRSSILANRTDGFGFVMRTSPEI